MVIVFCIKTNWGGGGGGGGGDLPSITAHFFFFFKTVNWLDYFGLVEKQECQWLTCTYIGSKLHT